MFDGLEHRDESLLSNIRMNNNPKRLIIRNKEIKSILEPNTNFNIKPVSNQTLLDDSEIPKSNKSILEDDSQESLYPDLRKELSSNSTTTTPKSSKNDSSSNLPVSSTMISSSAKTLFIPSQTSNEEEGKIFFNLRVHAVNDMRIKTEKHISPIFVKIYLRVILFVFRSR